jgi:copper homeostasis protein
LIALARPLCITFHKAFDQTSAPFEALDTLIDMGAERVLTSGGRPTALEGAIMLAQLVDRARGRITIMAGGRLDIANLEPVIRRGRISEIHIGSAARRRYDGRAPVQPLDGSDNSRSQTDAQRVAAIVTVVEAL